MLTIDIHVLYIQVSAWSCMTYMWYSTVCRVQVCVYVLCGDIISVADYVCKCYSLVS